MGPVLRRFVRHRTLVLTICIGVCLCLLLISVVDQWKPQNLPPKLKHVPLMMVNDRPTDVLLKSNQADTNFPWESEYENRVQRVRTACEKDEMLALRRVWRVATNRRFGKESFCKTKMCPIIVDEQKVLFFCFVPKVASTLVKKFFLNISDIRISEEESSNSTALHMAANNALRRVSPMYFPATTANKFFKIIFVRHPFDRLVSAFRNKAEAPRSEVPYFYDRYWDPIMQKLRPNGPLDQITFREFVWYLIHFPERDFNEHWSPYYSRCDPCLVDYDFVGKLETANHDFPYAFEKVGIHSGSEWWNSFENNTPRSLSLRYFSSVPNDEVFQLYNIYKFDFELFGYSAREFLPGNSTVI